MYFVSAWKWNPPQVFQIASHLVYWGKASIIYPLCENNVYVVSPKVGPDSMSNHSRLSQNFFKLFARNLQMTLSEFSLPVPLGKCTRLVSMYRRCRVIHVCLFASVCVCMCARVRTCACLFVCVSVSLCVCLHVFVCVCLFARVCLPFRQKNTNFEKKNNFF